MSYAFYKIIHLSSLFIFTFSLGVIWLFYNKKFKVYALDQVKQFKRNLMIFHSLSLFFIFVSGFALIAKLKIPFSWPLWVYIKISIWMILGMTPLLLKKGLPGVPKTRQGLASFIFLCFMILLALFSVIWKY